MTLPAAGLLQTVSPSVGRVPEEAAGRSQDVVDVAKEKGIKKQTGHSMHPMAPGQTPTEG